MRKKLKSPRRKSKSSPLADMRKKHQPTPPADIGSIVEYIDELVQSEINHALHRFKNNELQYAEHREYLERRVSTLEKWRLSVLASDTLGIQPALGDHESVLPVRYYIDAEDPAIADEIEHFLELLLDDMGFNVAAIYPVETGSWFRKFFFVSRERLTPDQLSESLSKLERSAGVRALDVPQSQVDLNRADGVAKLLTSLEKTENALVQIGSILVIKIEGTPIVVNLTPRELSELEKTPSVFRSPTDALSTIQKLRHQDNGSIEINQHNTTTG